MAGSVSGGKKAAVENKRKHGADFYVRIGQMGGSAEYSGLKGFAANRELASTAGRKGGQISKRSKPKAEDKEPSFFKWLLGRSA